MPPRDSAEKMQPCFQTMGPPPGNETPGGGGMIPPSGQTGPGGCKTAEECQTFCKSNPQECQNLSTPANQIPADQTQPGQPCEGENCQYGPPSTGQPCQGENCQYGPPPQSGNQPADQLCQGDNCQYQYRLEPGQQIMPVGPGQPQQSGGQEPGSNNFISPPQDNTQSPINEQPPQIFQTQPGEQQLLEQLNINPSALLQTALVLFIFGLLH